MRIKTNQWPLFYVVIDNDNNEIAPRHQLREFAQRDLSALQQQAAKRALSTCN